LRKRFGCWEQLCRMAIPRATIRTRVARSDRLDAYQARSGLMAYARFACDSDVYVFADTRGGFTCEHCPEVSDEFRCNTAAEMVTHLLTQHRAKAQRVPDDVIDELIKHSTGA
jgi:hypothetical protein